MLVSVLRLLERVRRTDDLRGDAFGSQRHLCCDREPVAQPAAEKRQARVGSTRDAPPVAAARPALDLAHPGRDTASCRHRP